MKLENSLPNSDNIITAIRMVMEIAIITTFCCIVSVKAGQALDCVLQTRPIFTLLFTVIGLAVTVLINFRLARRAIAKLAFSNGSVSPAAVKSQSEDSDLAMSGERNEDYD